MIDDLRFTLRSLRKTPGFTATAIGVLALGVALNVAVFAAVNALLFKPLGGRSAGRLLGVYDRDRARPDGYRRFAYPDYRLLRDHPGALQHVLAHEPVTLGVTDGDQATRVFASLVSANYFSTLAVRPALGRDFRPDEEAVGAARVAIVSDRYWRQHGADAALPGRTLRINGRDVTVVGVAPPGFSGATALLSPDVWLPLGACSILSRPGGDGDDTGCLADAQRRTLALVARVPAGVSEETATASLAPLSREIARSHGEPQRDIVVGRLSRLSIGAGPSGDMEVTLVLAFLSALALSVLLTAALNLANMLLARATSRGPEMAVRLALGGTTRHVLRLVFLESGLIAATAGALGVCLSAGSAKLLLAGISGGLPFALAFDVAPDARVLAAALAFAAAAAIACAIGPALALGRRNALSRLKEQSGTTGNTGRMSVRNGLVVAQLATSLALLTAAGLFAGGAATAAKADGGYPLAGKLVATLAPEMSGYGEARGREAYAAVLAQLRSHPGVTSASLASELPFGLDAESGLVRDAARGQAAEPQLALQSAIGADYFRTLGLPVLRGREFDEAEERGVSAARPVIVDKTLAARLWPGADPLGQSLQFVDDPAAPSTSPLEVVGVVPPLKHGLMDGEAMPHVYLPTGAAHRGQLHVVLQARPGEGAETAVLASIRDAVRRADPGLVVLGIDTLAGVRDRSFHLWFARAAATLFSAFGLAALLLSALGVYGVKSYLVARRSKEIAVRVALGATRRAVLCLVVGDGAALAACGLAAGIVLSLALSHVLASWIPQTGPLALLPLGSAALLLAVSVLLACWAPVRRATARAPWSVLRGD